ncbi:MAG: hypothetical protein QOI88_123 [Gammaproteobacteria bacterium]|nr:hypothetical protein [Gammaproteobacteria bacterium]
MRSPKRSLTCGKRLMIVVLLTGVNLVGGARASRASDHLDTPTVIGNPQADIGDVYAWTSASGRQLNLVMDIVGRSFSDKLQYAFHVDSAKKFGKTTATTSIVCRFPARNTVECRVADIDYASGDASGPEGLQGRKHRFRVFAGLRDDPFFNNVKGTRAAYQAAIAALQNGAGIDAGGCPSFAQGTSQAILHQWRHTDGGAPTNLLAGWTASSIVISIDLDVVTKGGKMLAVWSTTSTADKQLNRVGRPLTKNALLGLFAPDDVADQLKEQYNAATPATSARFIPEIEKGLALYDAFDGKCGNQLLADREAVPSMRYRALAAVLADDRLWVNSASSVCTQLFAVELANLAGQTALKDDCGGRTPNYNAANVWRSLLVEGTTVGVDDGLDHDEDEHSAMVFPFLAAPDAKSFTQD